MSRVLTVLLIVLALALAVAVVALWLRLREATRREALQALAARRGWGLTIAEGKLGRPAVLRLQPRGGSGWQLTARRGAGAGEGSAFRDQGGTTEYHSEEPDWPDGLLILGPPLPPDAGSPPALDSPEGRPLLARLVGADLAAHAPALRLWPGPAAFAVIATADPAHRADLGDLAKIYAALPPMTDPALFPVLVLGADGLRLRLRRDIRRADRMEGFIDLAQDLGRLLTRH
jgi:hypothetical protein